MSEVFEPLKTIHRFVAAKVVFGVNALEQIGVEAKQFNTGDNCLIITDPKIVSAGHADKVSKFLKKEGFSSEICDKVSGEPTLESLNNIVAIAKNAKPDFIVGLGGGSCLDTAKITAKAATQPGNLEKYLTENWEKPGIPLITVPTAAGTSTEYTRDAVFKLPDTPVKYWFDWVQTKVAIVDPLLCMTMPPEVTAGTGLDVLAHAVEMSLWKDSYPLIQAPALEAIRLVSENLRTATYQGSNLEARYNMSLAVQMMINNDEGALVSTEGHAVAHIIGPSYNIHHGTACAIVLPYCMEWSIPVNMPILLRIANAMGVNTNNLSAREAVYKGIYEVKRLIEDVGIPTSLQDVEGIDKKDIFSKDVLELFNHQYITCQLECSKRMLTKKDAVKFLEKMWEGNLGRP